MTKEQRKEKAEMVRYLLENEGRAMLCLNAASPGVEVPRRFAGEEGLQLILNRSMPNPIDIGDQAIESELRFGGVPHYCIMPYEAIWGAYNPDTGHGMYWPEAMTLAVRRNFESVQMSNPETPDAAASGLDLDAGPPPEQPFSDALQFKVIQGGSRMPRKQADKAPPQDKPHLRLVDDG